MMIIVFLYRWRLMLGAGKMAFCMTLSGCLYKYIDIREEGTKACMIMKIWIQKVLGLRSEWTQ